MSGQNLWEETTRFFEVTIQKYFVRNSMKQLVKGLVKVVLTTSYVWNYGRRF